MATADAYAQFSQLLMERVQSGLVDLVLENDGLAWTLLNSFEPETVAGRQTSSAPSDSTEFEARWDILIQHGGLITGGTVAGNTIEQMGPDNAYVTGQAADALYPDPTKAPIRSTQEIRMYLKAMKGVLALNRKQIFADLAAKPISKVVTDEAADAIRLVRDVFNNSFWHMGNGVYATVNNGAGYVVGEGSSRKLVSVDAGTIHRFVVGQRYVGASLTGTVPTTARAGSVNSPGVMRCVGKDLNTPAIILESEPGEGNITLVDNDGLIQEGMYDFTASAGRLTNSIENLLLPSTGGNYPGTTFDVADHPHLQSFVEGDESNLVEPEMELLSDILDKMLEAEITPPSIVVAEPAIWSRWDILERRSMGITQVPMGATFQAAGGVAGPMLSHGTHTFAKATDARIRPGSFIGLAPETFKKFLPRGKAIHWLNSNGGAADAASVFRQVTQGVQLTEVMSAEFEFFCQVGQTNPRRCFRRIGVKSQRTK